MVNEVGYAFISYSMINRVSADKMREILRNSGIDTWMAPYDISTSDNYAAAITSAVRECACLVLLLTNDAQISDNVDTELELAKKFKKPRIAIQLEEVKLNDSFEYYLSNCQREYTKKLDVETDEMRKILRAVMECVKPENMPTLNVYLCAALYQSRCSERQEAEKNFLKAIKDIKRLASKNPQAYENDLALAYYHTGNFYEDGGELTKAEDYYLEALKIYEKLYKESPPQHCRSLAKAYDIAGMFYEKTGLGKKAEKYYNKSLEIREIMVEEVPEQIDSTFIWSYKNVGDFYAERNIKDKAEKCYLREIEICRKIITPGCDERHIFNFVHRMWKMASFYEKENKFDDAEDYYIKSLNVYENSIDKTGDDEPLLAEAYLEAGLFYERHGVEKMAEKHLKQAFIKLDKISSENPEEFCHACANRYLVVGDFYNSHNMQNKAEDYYLKGACKLEFLEQMGINNSTELIEIYHKIGLLYIALNRLPTALEYFRRELEVITRTHNDDDTSNS